MIKNFLALFFSIFLLANENILEAFKDEIDSQSSVDFEILSNSYAKFNFIGGFADGKYKLSSYKISPIKDNVYKLSLSFVKRKGVFSFTQEKVVYFWYKGDKIVFLSKKGKYRYLFSKPFIKIKKLKDGYEIIDQKRIFSFKIPINSGYIILKIRK
ncbi:MAG TPA: hypothetical protein EYP79_02065 [Campylobacterales bacterium]|nr:hypothetical protein [Campylobacterales bacterium]